MTNSNTNFQNLMNSALTAALKNVDHKSAIQEITIVNKFLCKVASRFNIIEVNDGEDIFTYDLTNKMDLLEKLPEIFDNLVSTDYGDITFERNGTKVRMMFVYGNFDGSMYGNSSYSPKSPEGIEPIEVKVLEHFYARTIKQINEEWYENYGFSDFIMSEIPKGFEPLFIDAELEA